MSTLTICLPHDKHEGLKAPAKNRQISVNKLIDEWATIANHDARTRLAARPARGGITTALPVLERLGDL